MYQFKECVVCAAPAQVLSPLIAHSVTLCLDRVIDEVTEHCHREIMEAYAAGVRCVAVEDTTWGKLCDIGLTKTWGTGMVDTLGRQEMYLNVNNAVLHRLPDDMSVIFYAPNPGGYELVAEALFSHERVSVFRLDFAVPGHGDSDVLRYLPRDSFVEINIVGASCRPEVDSVVREISFHVPFDRFRIMSSDRSLEDLFEMITKEYWGIGS